MKNKGDVPRKVLVTIAREQRGSIEQIAGDLAAAGMHVSEVYQMAGTVAGVIPSAAWNRVFAVEGVSSIEEEPIFRAM